MDKTASIVALLIVLSGCASGRVLDGAEAGMIGAAKLHAQPGVVLRITPLYDTEQVTEVDRSMPLSLGVTEGWYKVAYFCDLPNCGDTAGEITLREYGTDRNIHAKAGRHYELSCSCKRSGVLKVREIGVEFD